MCRLMLPSLKLLLIEPEILPQLFAYVTGCDAS